MFETTRNPWDLARTSGRIERGRSGGETATRIPLAIGSDGGGSVRIPASFCGTYGIKPTLGRIPLYPGARDERFPGASGWGIDRILRPAHHERCGDSALMLASITGPDMRDRHSLPRADFEWLHSLRGRPARQANRLQSRLGLHGGRSRSGRYRRQGSARARARPLRIVEETNPGWENPAAAFAAVMIAETDLRGMRKNDRSARLANVVAPGRVDEFHPWTAEDLTAANMARKALVEQDGAADGALRSPHHADRGGRGVSGSHVQGPDKSRAASVRPGELHRIHLPAELHRPTGRLGARRLHFAMVCRSASRSSVVILMTRWSFAPRPPLTIRATMAVASMAAAR